MRIAISTVHRPGVEYVHETLRSMYEADCTVAQQDVVLCVGNTDTEYVKHYSNVDPMPLEVWEALEKEAIGQPFHISIGRKITANFLRCVQKIAEGDDEMGIACEDDLRCAPGWLRRARLCGEEAARRWPEGWVLTLHTPYPPAAFRGQYDVSDDRVWSHRSNLDFYGNQCLLLPSHVAARMCTWVREPEAQNYDLVGDQLIKWYCEHWRLPILAMIPSPIEHVGFESTYQPGTQRHVAFRWG